MYFPTEKPQLKEKPKRDYKVLIVIFIITILIMAGLFLGKGA